MQSQAPAIEMAGLTKQFGRHRAVDSLNLAVHAGSVFGFLGPNGAGKTTTIRMLLGLIRPTQGGGRVLGYDIERERAAILPHVGAIVESPAFYPILSGRDNLRVFARTAGNEDARNIARVLEQGSSSTWSSLSLWRPSCSAGGICWERLNAVSKNDCQGDRVLSQGLPWHGITQ